LPAGTNGEYVYYSERSNGQTFIPILANFRFTNLAFPLQAYLTAGLAATSSPSKSLFGLSIGTENYLFTLGFHSSDIDVLQPGITPNAFNSLPAANAPVTFTQRTTRPFASINFPLCSVSSIFGGLTGSQTCTAASPAPAPTTAPTTTTAK
jgi:hypothetical protein